jgi:hypothetical protein
MSAVTESQIQFLSQKAISQLVLDRAPRNEFARILPFVPIEGYELQIGGIDAAGSLASYAQVETEGSSIVTTVPTITSRTFKLARLSSILEVYTITQDKYDNVSSILQTLTEIKVRAVKDLFHTKLYTGDAATAGEFDGLVKLADSYSQVFGADNGNVNGGTVKKGELEKLRASVQDSTPGAEVVFVMNARAYQHLLAVNYSDVEFINHPVLGMIPALAGVPVVIDNFISTAETLGSGSNLTSIYCVCLGKNGVSGLVPSGKGNREIRVRGPITSATAGVMTYQISWDVGIAAWNKAGFARMRGVAWQNIA